jgi:hypothetical protein
VEGRQTVPVRARFAAVSATLFAPATSRLAESRTGTICRSSSGIERLRSPLDHAAKNRVRETPRRDQKAI